METGFTFSRILREARGADASDIHLIAGLPPTFRVSGEIIVHDAVPLTRDDLLCVAGEVLTGAQRELLDQENEICFSYFDPDCGRVRLSFYHRLGVPELAARLCNLEVKPADELMLPREVDDLALRAAGLVIVTGPTGMGKTTTLNYMIDLINATRRGKIVTIEDPVEFEHRHRKSIVVQIEVGTDTRSFAHCLRHVLRLDPDVICVGEMRDLDTIETALVAAETGHFVLATLHTPSAFSTVERIIGSFEGSRQPQICLQLANVLQGVIAQRLLPTVDKSRRVLACEVLMGSHGVRNLIRENKGHQIRNAMFAARGEGMVTLESSLLNLYQRGLITFDQALQNAHEPKEFRQMVKGPGEGAT